MKIPVGIELELPEAWLPQSQHIVSFLENVLSKFMFSNPQEPTAAIHSGGVEVHREFQIPEIPNDQIGWPKKHFVNHKFPPKTWGWLGLGELELQGGPPSQVHTSLCDGLVTSWVEARYPSKLGCSAFVWAHNMTGNTTKATQPRKHKQFCFSSWC